MDAKHYIYIQNKYFMKVVTARESRVDDLIVERDIREACAEVKAHIEGKTELPRAEDIVF